MSGPRAKLAFAADVPLEEGLALYARIAASVGCAKVGLSLFVEHGPRAVERFRAAGAEVFLDLKLHDIPNTVQLAAARAAALGVRYLTVHAQGGDAMLRAALEGANDGAARAGVPMPRVLAVTVLTSLGAGDLRAQGLAEDPAGQVERLARLAQGAGVRGLVCSAKEVGAVRRALGAEMFLCTPGIRPPGASAADQARVEGPAEAIRGGSDLLVVGRPLSGAEDPGGAAAALLAAIALADA